MVSSPRREDQETIRELKDSPRFPTDRSGSEGDLGPTLSRHRGLEVARYKPVSKIGVGLNGLNNKEFYKTGVRAGRTGTISNWANGRREDGPGEA